MADLDFLQRSSPVQVVGGDEINPADVTDNKELATTDGIRAQGVYGALTVGTSAVEIKVGGSRLTNRKAVTFYNNSNQVMYWGFNSSVTTSNGTPIAKNEFVVWQISDVVQLWVIAGQAGLNSRVTESR